MMLVFICRPKSQGDWGRWERFIQLYSLIICWPAGKMNITLLSARSFMPLKCSEKWLSRPRPGRCTMPLTLVSEWAQPVAFLTSKTSPRICWQFCIQLLPYNCNVIDRRVPLHGSCLKVNINSAVKEKCDKHCPIDSLQGGCFPLIDTELGKEWVCGGKCHGWRWSAWLNDVL